MTRTDKRGLWPRLVDISKPRKRSGVLGVLLVVIILGLASRKLPHLFPVFVVVNAGDALWTIAVYLTLALVFPAWSPLRLGLAAVATSLVVEVSQLLDLRPLNTMRSTTFGRLLLGEGFLWADLPRYAAGAAIVTALDQIRINISKKNGRAKVDNPTTG